MTPEPRHVYPIRVFYEDTDAAGIVYYANYLKFAERARTELLRNLGFEHRTLMERDGVVFAVRRCEAEYLRPARLDDLVEVHSQDVAMKGATLDADQVVRRGDEDLARLQIRLACLDLKGRPTRWPVSVVEAFRPYISRNRGL